MKTLLLGNGINHLNTTGISWEEVIQKLLKFTKIKKIKNINKKPFPLVYEEIALSYFRKSRITDSPDTELKSYISSILREMNFNKIHKRIVNSRIKNILTTNYDYCLENSEVGCEKADLGRENKFSLFRRRKLNETFIWHIHGEIEKPNTITLGYDHYAGYLWRIKDYLHNSSPFIHSNYNFYENSKIFSWVDLFLLTDLYIVGLSLDYSEVNLWWLLIHKERLKLRGKPVGETIYYQIYDNDISDYEEAKLSLMESIGIKTISIESKYNYKHAYNIIFNEIKAIR